MSSTPQARGRVIAGLAAIALAVPLFGATASDADAATWVCVHTYHNGRTVGKACFKGNTAQVCDLRADGRSVYGTFGVRSVGVRTFRDSNGAASPCSYRTYSHPVVSVSAYNKA